MAARLGGDEFSLFLDDPEDEAAVMDLARQVPRALARPIAVRGQQVRLGATLGIALYPRDGGDVTTLFQHANIALSRAKQAGRGTAQSFDPAMMVSFEEHRMMESDLRRALDSDELELCLQPQFSCATLDVTGFEALTRWRHPTRGLLSPTMFIPVAERSGLINPLGLWAIEQACRAAAGWRTRAPRRGQSLAVAVALRNHPGGHSRDFAAHPVSGASAGAGGDRERAAG